MMNESQQCLNVRTHSSPQNRFRLLSSSWSTYLAMSCRQEGQSDDCFHHSLLRKGKLSLKCLLHLLWFCGSGRSSRRLLWFCGSSMMMQPGCVLRSSTVHKLLLSNENDPRYFEKCGRHAAVSDGSTQRLLDCAVAIFPACTSPVHKLLSLEERASLLPSPQRLCAS